MFVYRQILLKRGNTLAKSTYQSKGKLQCNGEGVRKHRRHNNLTRNLISFPFGARFNEEKKKQRLNASFHSNCA